MVEVGNINRSKIITHIDYALNFCLMFFGFSLFLEPFQGLAWKILITCSLTRLVLAPPKLLRIDLLVFSILIFNLAVTLHNNTYSECYAVIKLILFYLCGISFRYNYKKAETLMKSTLCGLVISLVFILLNWSFGYSSLYKAYETDFRLNLFTSPNTSAFYLIFLMLGTFLSKGLTGRFPVEVFKVLFFALLILLVNVKAGFLAVFAIAILLCLSPKMRKAAIKTFYVGIAITLMGSFTNMSVEGKSLFSGVRGLTEKVIGKLDDEKVGGLNGVNGVKSLANGRFLIWCVGSQGIYENWFTGLGRRSFSNFYVDIKKHSLASGFKIPWCNKDGFFDQSYVESKSSIRSAHNFLLGFIFEFGVPASLVFGFLGLNLFKSALREHPVEGSGVVVAWLLSLFVFPIGHYFVYRPVLEITFLFLAAYAPLSLMLNKDYEVKKNG